MKKKKWIIAVVVVVLLCIIFGSGGDEDEQKQGEVTKVENRDSGEESSADEASDNEASDDTTSGESAPLVFKEGETAAKDGIEITMTKVKESKGKQYNRPGKGKVFLICDFLVENKSENDYTMSMLDYNASADGFTLSECYYSDEEDFSSLSGTIAPGNKLKGSIAFEVDKKYKKFEISFDMGDLFAEEKVTFINEK